jgi:hypothetical protein
MRPLKNRINVVLSRDIVADENVSSNGNQGSATLRVVSEMEKDIIHASSLEEGLSLLGLHGGVETVFVIGGGQVSKYGSVCLCIVHTYVTLGDTHTGLASPGFSGSHGIAAVHRHPHHGNRVRRGLRCSFSSNRQ